MTALTEKASKAVEDQNIVLRLIRILDQEEYALSPEDKHDGINALRKLDAILVQVMTEEIPGSSEK